MFSYIDSGWFYERMANDIFHIELIAHVPTLIEEQLPKSKDTPGNYYIKVMQALSSSKSHVSYLERVPEKTPIKTEIDGTLIYLNKKASEWEPLFIVGKSPDRISSIVAELKEIFLEKNRAQKRIAFENYYADLKLKENMVVVLREAYINLSKLSSIEFNFEVGDLVKKGYSIGDIEHVQYTETAKKYKERYAAALEHCTIKLYELRMKSSTDNLDVYKKRDRRNKIQKMKEQFFVDIWAKDQKNKYNSLIEAITAIRLDNGKGIIYKRGEILEWSPEPAKGTQMYLAAFFYECEDANLLDITKYEGRIPVIIEILNRSFKIDCGSEAFHDIKNDNKDIYIDYKKVFRKIVRKISNAPNGS